MFFLKSKGPKKYFASGPVILRPGPADKNKKRAREHTNVLASPCISTNRVELLATCINCYKVTVKFLQFFNPLASKFGRISRVAGSANYNDEKNIL